MKTLTRFFTTDILISSIILIVLIFILRSFMPLFMVINVVCFLIFAIGFNVLYGYLGLLSFGHMAYYGLGAYVIALYLTYIGSNVFLGILFSTAITAFIAFLLAIPFYKLHAAFFALGHLAFNHILYFLVLIPLATYTGGEDGIRVPLEKFIHINFYNREVVFYFSLLLLLAFIMVFRKFEKSSFYSLLIAMKENETRVNFMGYNTFIVRTLMYVISAALSSLAGVLSAINNAFVTPSFIHPVRNPEVVFAVLLGGPGTVYGAIVGGIAYSLLSYYIAAVIQTWEFFLGVGLLTIVYVLRKGIYDLVYSSLLKKVRGG